MFGWFKKRDKSLDRLARVQKLLKAMGFEITPHGVAAALISMESSYSEADTAAGIAIATFARSMKAADNFLLQMAINIHAIEVYKFLSQLREQGALHPTQWQNDSQALRGVTSPSEHQAEWIEKVLSDPLLGKEPVAISTVNYQSHMDRALDG